MKQTIEIEVPDGKKAVWKDGKVVYENIKPNPPRFPKTWEEFCEFYPIPRGSACIDRDSNLLFRWDNRRCDLFDRNVLPSEKAAKAHRALMQLHQLRDCYNDNWHCDWTNEHETNAVITRSHGELIVRADWAITTFLTFKSIEIANEFLFNFRDLIDEAGDLI